MIIYKVEVETIGDDWQTYSNHFFLTYEETQTFIEHYEETHRKDDEYIPTIKSIYYYTDSNDFEKYKHQMSISDYENLFNKTITE